jgi:hypothetical protein
VTVLAPAFLVCSSSLMSDTLMVGFWVWAMVFWEKGVERGKWIFLFLSCVFIALSFLTKYFGISLVPLLALYTLMRTRRHGLCQLLPLLIPIAAALAYEWGTANLYGHGLFREAFSFAGVQRVRSSPATWMAVALVSSTFVGGCIAPVLFYWPLLWSRRTLLVLAAAIVAAGWLANQEATSGYARMIAKENHWPAVVETAIFAVAGVSTLALAIADWWTRRDARSVLLFVWVAGTWCFLAVNWTINGRSTLPMIPAVGILVMRRLDQRYGVAAGRIYRGLWWPLIPAACLSLLVVTADYFQAGAGRLAAKLIHERIQSADHVLWFQGHWGFQYYLEKYGGRAFDAESFEGRPGDFMIVPERNTNTVDIPRTALRERPPVVIGLFPGISTLHPRAGASFYSSSGGLLLPFIFAVAPYDVYHVFEIRVLLRSQRQNS